MSSFTWFLGSEDRVAGRQGSEWWLAHCLTAACTGWGVDDRSPGGWHDESVFSSCSATPPIVPRRGILLPGSRESELGDDLEQAAGSQQLGVGRTGDIQDRLSR